MKVLLIEDNVSSRKLVRRIVTRAGYTYLEASDAKTGIELARREMPALILMDINLPGMNGLAATTILKEDPRTAAIPIIAFTAYAMKGDREAMLEAGCDDYISKPIGYLDFVAKIESWLKQDTPGGATPSETDVSGEDDT